MRCYVLMSGVLFLTFFVASRGFAETVATGPVDRPENVESEEPTTYLTGQWFGVRKSLADFGLTIEPDLTVDWSKNFMGGVSTGDSFRDRGDVPFTLDTGKAFGLQGGTIVAVYQWQHGGNASHELTGDAQNFAFGTNADGRSQLGKLYYEQKFLDRFRFRIGKLDGNDDFDVLDNGLEFLNNSFSTSPTLGLMPSFPQTAMGTELFYEVDDGPYIGAGMFDGSQARGVNTGEYGPSHFLDSADNLFLIAEGGTHYTLRDNLPGKVGLGGWYDTNSFQELDGSGTRSGTGGAYVILDQALWRPFEGKRKDDGLSACFSAGYCDPLVNFIDGGILAGVTETGLIPSRPIDIAGFGATAAHFSDHASTRNPFETSIEAFYRFRFSESVSLKPDLQYIIHPSGGGNVDEPVISNALVFTLRLEVTF